MATIRLDPALLGKMSTKTRKDKQYLREQISRKASRTGVSSLAAQVLWAQELGIGVGRILNRAPEVREEIRNGQQRLAIGAPVRKLGRQKAPRRTQGKPITRPAIDSLLQDKALRDRCRDLLSAPRHFDRAFREATTVLDDRLKKKSGITNMNPLNLVGKVLNPDPQKAIIEVSAERDEQDGFYSLCKGIMLSFRNTTHHELSDKFTREDALKFCGFIDTILTVIDQAKLHPERV